MLQHDRQLKVIAANLKKKILASWRKCARTGRATSIFKNFGLDLKYGDSNYGANKDELQDLLLFHSSTEETLTTLSEYTSRMPESQKYIYCCRRQPDRH